MVFPRSKHWIISSFGLAVMSLGHGQPARADVLPEWSNEVVSGQDRLNESFLSNTQLNPGKDSSQPILDPKTSADLRVQYEDMNRDYEMRKNYGLADTETERAHTGQVSDFTRNVVNQVSHYQMTVQTAGLRDVIGNSDLVKKIEKPATIPAAIAAVYMGHPVEMQVSEKTRVSAATDVRNQAGQFNLASPLVNGSVNVAASVPATADPTVPPPVDIAQHEERYRISLSRGLPLLGMNTGVMYGSTSSTLNASVSKILMPNLIAVVDTTYPLSPDISDVKDPQQTVKLLYGIRF